MADTAKGQGYLRRHNRDRGNNKTPPSKHDTPVFVPNTEQPKFVPNP